eukprot:120436-Chlamydomonas_euryale.AAC.9
MCAQGRSITPHGSVHTPCGSVTHTSSSVHTPRGSIPHTPWQRPTHPVAASHTPSGSGPHTPDRTMRDQPHLQRHLGRRDDVRHAAFAQTTARCGDHLQELVGAREAADAVERLQLHGRHALYDLRNGRDCGYCVGKRALSLGSESVGVCCGRVVWEGSVGGQCGRAVWEGSVGGPLAKYDKQNIQKRRC